MSILSPYEFLSLGFTTERFGFRLDFRLLENGSRATKKMVSGHQMDISGDLPAIFAGVVLTRQGGASHGYASPRGSHFS